MNEVRLESLFLDLIFTGHSNFQSVTEKIAYERNFLNY